MRLVIALVVCMFTGCATTGSPDPTAELEGADVTTRMIDGDRIDE